MRKNVFGVKNLSSIIYGIICLFPMFAILGRVIYTQSNQNAKDSYSITQSTETIYTPNIVTLEVGQFYYFEVNNETYLHSIGSTVNIKSFSTIGGTWGTINFNPNRFENYQTGNGKFIHLSNSNTNKHLYVKYADTSGVLTSILSFTFQMDTMNNYNNPFINEIQKITFGEQNKLDNAFEYSISEFTKDNNFGEIDCFGWFTDVFLDSSNAKNMLYINFLNWYLNYTLFASCGYIMFLVIYWFINFVRRILDKSMYQEYGGF